ncbi:MAG: preprotein translocase subunit SecA [Alphaproteobacteria bacterium]|nr:preprotein translocase subunit SecA [Alphaproteobacteria bacterium]
MLLSLVRRLLGSHNDRVLRAQDPIIEKINALEPAFQNLSDDALRAKTQEFRNRLKKGEALDALLPEAFATVREASWRVLGLRPFDVQLRGGIVLHQGKIAEMRTGEGKTLVAVLPSYLNALSGKGVHIVTVNDYLAQRDSEWMGRIHNFLGLSVGCIVHGLDDAQRQAAYAADITYGTNNEFGFDYLRDNMKFEAADLVQRPFNFAIVDEVDSILIDEARTPLIISGPAEDSSELYTRVDALIPALVPDDYEKDEKSKTVTLTEIGNEHIEKLLGEAGLLAPNTTTGGLYDPANITIVHHVNQALRAHKMFARDVDYIVKNDKVIIIDEFTGRMMEGRRFSEGLHQALEAKECVTIQRENQTLASITFQNYFRLYPKLSGMTGTALTEAAEFAEIYNLDVIEIPTNVAVCRDDMNDEVYGTLKEKNDAILALIEDCRKRGQPALVGTVSIEKSEALSAMLKKKGVPHNVLNARFHDQEAAIIAQAGRPGAVTIATNMAGRGTDIQLGGNFEARLAELCAKGEPDEKAVAALRKEVEEARAAARAAGGLFVIGTERHESRRIDNQLRGRSGRQGDPGASKFFLSLEDDLMRIFGTHNQTQAILAKLGLRDGEKIAHPWITAALAKAQQKVEARNFDIRKNLLKFDNIMNDQRKVVYEQRRDIMATDDLSEAIRDLRNEVIHDRVVQAIPPHTYPEQWDIAGLRESLKDLLSLDLPLDEWAAQDGVTEVEIEERIKKSVEEKIKEKLAVVDEDAMRRAEKAALLGTLDQEWKDHLLALDQLRQGIHLRGYGQRDPLNEYSREAFGLFQLMLASIRDNVTKALMQAGMNLPSMEEILERQRAAALTELSGEEAEAFGQLQAAQGDSVPRHSVMPIQHAAFDPKNPDTWSTTPRNAPCPCGSGKKYKHCHGAVH